MEKSLKDLIPNLLYIYSLDNMEEGEQHLLYSLIYGIMEGTLTTKNLTFSEYTFIYSLLKNN